MIIMASLIWGAVAAAPPPTYNELFAVAGVYCLNGAPLDHPKYQILEDLINVEEAFFEAAAFEAAFISADSSLSPRRRRDIASSLAPPAAMSDLFEPRTVGSVRRVVIVRATRSWYRCSCIRSGQLRRCR